MNRHPPTYPFDPPAPGMVPARLALCAGIAVPHALGWHCNGFVGLCIVWLVCGAIVMLIALARIACELHEEAPIGILLFILFHALLWPLSIYFDRRAWAEPIGWGATW